MLVRGAAVSVGRLPDRTASAGTEEVENLLYQLPVASRGAAIEMPDPELGERVCAATR